LRLNFSAVTTRPTATMITAATANPTLTTRFNSPAALLTPDSKSWAIATLIAVVIPEMNAAAARNTRPRALPLAITV
jgi:hypothetical protein